MKTISVDLGDRTYPIFIEDGLLQAVETWIEYCSKQVLVVTNTKLAPLYGEKLCAKLNELGVPKVAICVLPDGEQYKHLETLNRVFDVLLEQTFNRSVTIVALGGGVVGDMAGFAAASYQRGVNFIQIPTTLLAQVDSSVGGKTGVNHALGKNMIGAFYQPQCVVIDLSVFQTLDQRELIAGLAEVIKYGLIYDSAFFEWLEQNMEALLAREPTALAYAIEQSCRIKAEVVSQDEKESGIRAILNLGHTFGHAIESHRGYGNWLHGEAVGAGMVMACDVSWRLGWIDRSVLDRVIALIQLAGLPIAGPDNMASEDYLAYMAVDKKVLDTQLRLVLLNKLGDACVTSDFDAALLLETLASN